MTGVQLEQPLPQGKLFHGALGIPCDECIYKTAPSMIVLIMMPRIAMFSRYDDRPPRGGGFERRSDSHGGFERRNDSRGGFDRGHDDDRRGGYRPPRDDGPNDWRSAPRSVSTPAGRDGWNDGPRRGGFDDGPRRGGFDDGPRRDGPRAGGARPRLNLQKRSKPVEEGGAPVANSAIFGGAKPVDAEAKLREIEEKEAAKRKQLEEEAAKAKEQAAKRADPFGAAKPVDTQAKLLEIERKLSTPKTIESRDTEETAKPQAAPDADDFQPAEKVTRQSKAPSSQPEEPAKAEHNIHNKFAGLIVDDEEEED
eukprot:TRINITY_DN8111_c0_g1_i3.p1 TRINITY_DN8111_c0_g1~~TRINITY_DN8111_c0_g1_i3.p1  ORF type:complete len:310 (+),score=80.10 TRINITY_DN8111_c0_g1_i3:560-1489(+)